MTARKQRPSDVERRRINALGGAIFEKPGQLRNSSMPNGYTTPVWNHRECGNKLIKSIGK